MLIDAHEVLLDGLENGLVTEGDLQVVARASTVAQSLAHLATTAVDIVLFDIRLADGSGLDLLAESSGEEGRPDWIVLSGLESQQSLAAAVRLGAAGYLLKTAPMADVVDAIRRVAAGHCIFSMNQLRIARDYRASRLSTLERNIIGGLLDGRSNDEIACELGVARKTVEHRLSRLYDLHDVASRTALALRADRECWLYLP